MKQGAVYVMVSDSEVRLIVLEVISSRTKKVWRLDHGRSSIEYKDVFTLQRTFKQIA